MERRLLLYLLLLIWGPLQAQITLTNSYFPQVGDTLKISVDGIPDITITPPGGDQNWDYSNLQGLDRTEVIRAASDGVNGDQFPNAAFFVPFGPESEGGETYGTISDTEYKFVGYAGPDPAQLGINVIVDFNPPILDRRAPLSFFDINDQESAILVAFSAEFLPSELLDSLLITPDSVRVRVASERLDVVDAWGNLTLPGGNSYEVLREKRTEERETRLDAKVGIGPFATWIDVTDFLGFLDFLGRDTVTEYHFYANDIKEPIVRAVVTNDGSDTPLFVEYKTQDIISNVNYVNTGRSDVVAYPNPAIDQVRFDFMNLNSGNYTLKIFNILGVEIMSDTFAISNNRTVQKDIGYLSKGTYLYSLVDFRGKTLSTKRLVIIRP
ncbi:MAG: T9SS type A sorting domain-containing protein [Bacteroidota bacterium]